MPPPKRWSGVPVVCFYSGCVTNHALLSSPHVADDEAVIALQAERDRLMDELFDLKISAPIGPTLTALVDALELPQRQAR